MDVNYLHKKLAEKSKAELTKELQSRVKDLNYIDGELVKLSERAKTMLKTELDSLGYANRIISIILDDLVESSAEKRLKIDIDKFIINTEKIRDQLNYISGESIENL